MKWIPSELYLLAFGDCNQCGGSGVRREKRGQPVPCGCALRGIFRTCLMRFRDCVARGKCRTQVSFERNPRGQSGRGAWGRKEEEYIADFELISRRTLDPFHSRVFRYHFLLGADWKLCCRRMRIDRGTFFHAIYRIEERLGKAFYETEPYALYPPSDYFVARRLDPQDLVAARIQAEPATATRRFEVRAAIPERLSA